MCLVAAVCLSFDATAQRPPTTADDPLALMNASIVDVRSGRITAGATIVLRNGKIESIGSNTRPAGIKGVDLKGNYVLPGLIDAHAHPANLEAFRRALESGVTTARSAGVSYYADVGFRELVKAGAVAGPDVIAAGYHVRPQLANEAFLSDPQYWDLMSGVTTVERIRRAVRMNLSHGVDWIKVHATERGGTADTDPRKQVYTEAEIRAIVQEAATKNVPVQAHAHGDEGAVAAIRAGVRSVEHGTYLSDATLQLMKERGVYLVPTYGIVIDLRDAGGAFDSPALRIRGEHMLPRARDMLQRAHRIGVRIVAATDSDYGPNSVIRIGQEMTYFVEFGFTPLESIQAATIRAAEMLRLEKSIGVVEAGYEADLIAVEKNPLGDITTLQDPLLVISNGRVVFDRLNPDPTRAAGARR
ncbi:MAG TPA: amidohydrolase family protein [Gemmatimonadaceae bacterium]|nr:amidohydrolase family protein [Gemmatimonadaceae bacterium]